MPGTDYLFLDGHCIHGSPIRVSMTHVRAGGPLADDCEVARKERALLKAMEDMHRSLSLKERLALFRGRLSLRRRFDDLLK